MKDHGSTLHIVKSEHQKVFGGFRSKPYPGNGSWTKDPKAFIFSLTNKKKLSLIDSESQNIYSGSESFSHFGSNGANDLVIWLNSKKEMSSYSSLGYTYHLPDELI